MAISAIRQGRIALLWGVNVAFLALMLAAAITVDGNERIFGLNEGVSRVGIITIVAIGLAADGLIIWLDKRGRLRAVAIGILLVYMIVWFVPAILP